MNNRLEWCREWSSEMVEMDEEREYQKLQNFCIGQDSQRAIRSSDHGGRSSEQATDCRNARQKLIRSSKLCVSSSE